MPKRKGDKSGKPAKSARVTKPRSKKSSSTTRLSASDMERKDETQTTLADMMTCFARDVSQLNKLRKFCEKLVGCGLFTAVYLCHIGTALNATLRIDSVEYPFLLVIHHVLLAARRAGQLNATQYDKTMFILATHVEDVSNKDVVDILNELWDHFYECIAAGPTLRTMRQSLCSLEQILRSYDRVVPHHRLHCMDWTKVQEEGWGRLHEQIRNLKKLGNVLKIASCDSAKAPTVCKPIKLNLQHEGSMLSTPQLLLSYTKHQKGCVCAITNPFSASNPSTLDANELQKYELIAGIPLQAEAVKFLFANLFDDAGLEGSIEFTNKDGNLPALWKDVCYDFEEVTANATMSKRKLWQNASSS